jgi:enamine deaminase RidA (YjgF/YER057c/UK114 family)
MTSSIDIRLRELKITLPAASEPGANYIQATRLGSLLCVTGQLPKWEGERRYIGRLGAEFDVAQGQEAARLCALNILAVVHEALGGDLDRVVRCLRVRGYVNATPEFTGHSQVMNGASDLFVAVFGDAGRHTRIAVGASLPYGCAVEVEADFEVRP